jgi:hypothetical protein
MHRAASTLLVALAAALAPLAAPAETIGGNPGPAYNYVCPHADGQGAMACYLDAVEHLYTMCRNVKAIEILTYGYEESLDGVNAAKYESCVEKQKHNMARPYAAALKEAHRDKALAEALRGLHEDWTAALARIRWNRGESDADYKARVAAAYDGFHARIDRIHLIVAEEKARSTAVAARPSGRKSRSVASAARHDAASAKPAAKAKKSAPAKAASSTASAGSSAAVTGTVSTPPAGNKATPDRDKAPQS